MTGSKMQKFHLIATSVLISILVMGLHPGLVDFVGVATHEIGHALGFVSGVDIVDLTSGVGPFAPMDLSDYRVFNVLDLYR